MDVEAAIKWYEKINKADDAYECKNDNVDPTGAESYSADTATSEPCHFLSPIQGYSQKFSHRQPVFASMFN